MGHSFARRSASRRWGFESNTSHEAFDDLGIGDLVIEFVGKTLYMYTIKEEQTHWVILLPAEALRVGGGSNPIHPT